MRDRRDNPNLNHYITRNRAERTIRLSQVTTFGMENANPASTPMDPNVVLRENEESGGDSRASQAYVTAINWQTTVCGTCDTPRYPVCSSNISTIHEKPIRCTDCCTPFRICRVALVGPTLLTSLYKSITDFSYFFQLPMSSAIRCVIITIYGI
jgi:hypothetical protein